MEIKVKVEFVIPVIVPDREDYDATFDIEENHCPGTGLVGAAIDAHIKKLDAENMCWACALGGKCTIVDEPLAMQPNDGTPAQNKQ